MALHADTIWEVRTGGNNENGGGFHDRVPGTSVDYTQQNAPQLDLTDLACAGAGVTTITSAVGGFTAAMEGNIIRIHTGANFTVGFYEIVTVNSGNSVTLDRTPATGVGANGHGKVGGGQVNLDLIDVVVIGGNTIYIENGNYAAHPAVSFGAVPAGPYPVASPLTIWGYNTARTTSPTGVNRPILQFGANQFSIPQCNIKIRNIAFEGTANGIVVIMNGSLVTPQVRLFENCKFTNLSSVAGDRNCVIDIVATADPYIALFIDCEFSGTTGTATPIGIQTVGSASGHSLVIFNCYFHNLSYGLQLVGGNNSGLILSFSIFANILLDGINFLNGIGQRVINCTFADIGGNGYQNAGDGTGSVFMNNTFSNCVSAGIRSQAAVVMNNNFFGNGNNWIGGTLNPVDNNTFIAPQFVAPGSNYALQRTSGLIDRAFSMRLGV
jgi:hypothetical protein